MPPKGKFNPNRASLATSLDRKVESFVRRFVDEQSQSQSNATDKFASVRLPLSQIFAYVHSADASFQRMKKAQLEKAIDKALAVLKDEEDDEEDELDSDFEGLDEMGSMEVKETNFANKRITDLWGTNKAIVSGSSTPVNGTTNATTPVREKTPASETPPTPAISTAISPHPRKRERTVAKEVAKEAKRQKGENARAPPTGVRLADIGGVEGVISDILELISMPLTHPEVYSAIGIQLPRGVLLHGPPGCGKTMLANAIAGELKVPFISISAPSIVSGMSGESEKKLREIFDEAKQLAPCIIFIDEIDAVTPKRESAQREMEKRIVAQMLTCMDDLALEKTDGKPVLVIGATNRPDSLDPALRRAGRFDREICMNVPDEEGREKILRKLSEKLRLSGDFDFKLLAKMTPGFVGADLMALTTAAGIAAIKRIFETLKVTAFQGDAEAGVLPDADPMVVDLDVEQAFAVTAPGPGKTSTSAQTIMHNFLARFPNPLTPEELEPLSITVEDFFNALPKVQPSSKREGFATVPDVTWQDIGALQGIRLELEMAIVQPILQPEKYQSVGIFAPTGVLLWGPPGCGKTLLAKAVANESRANFISVKGPELLNKYVGESERAVRQVFTRARASSPCVIFFDELDALVPRRDDSPSDASTRVVNTLLTELDGLNDRKGVFVIGATNRPDIIDPAMLRPGRFDRPLFVELPTPSERCDILRKLTKTTPLHPDVDLKSLAEDARGENFSGADLQSLVREAATSALRSTFFKNINVTAENPGGLERRVLPSTALAGEQILVTVADFDRAYINVRPSVTKSERAKYSSLAVKFGWGKSSI